MKYPHEIESVILVTGSRHGCQKHKVDFEFAMDMYIDYRIPDKILIVHGGAAGVDNLAENYANRRGIRTRVFPYLRRYGRAGGPIRNQEMVWLARGAKACGQEAFVVAFPIKGYHNVGTEGCVLMAKRAGLNVYRCEVLMK